MNLRMVVLGILIQLFVVGCGDGAGLFSGLFGGGNPGFSEVLDSLSSGSGPSDGAFSSPEGGALGGGGGEGTSGISQVVASVHSPEPGGLALFGIGLAGLAHLKRRAKRGRSR